MPETLENVVVPNTTATKCTESTLPSLGPFSVGWGALAELRSTSQPRLGLTVQMLTPVVQRTEIAQGVTFVTFYMADPAIGLLWCLLREQWCLSPRSSEPSEKKNR